MLQHRTSDAPRKPDHWGFFGGHTEEEESPEEAAVREFKEELQIELELSEVKFFRRYTFDEEGESVMKFFFAILLDEDVEKLKAEQLEGSDLGYFRHSDLQKLKISSNDRIVLNTAFDLLTQNWH